MILYVLYDEMDKWLGRDNVINEYWDVLDEKRNLTRRKYKRIDDMPPGDYHLVVRAWIINSKGEFLITRRAFNKIGFPGMWEVPSGSAVAGEESLEATIREAKEECGIPLLPENGTMFSTYRRGNSFYDNWLFRQEFELSDVVLQDSETIDARAVTWRQIAEMMEHGEFIGRDVFPEFDLLENPNNFKIWYHGSPLELTELAAGSTITGWRELAEAFSHKPQTLSYDTVGGTISHNGQLGGFLYIVDEPFIEGTDIYKHPRTTMDNGLEWLTKKPLKLRKIGFKS